MIESLTLPVVPWLTLAALAGFLVGWWIRGRGMAGRELTLRRKFNNQVSAIEEDARRVLERARADSEENLRKLETERDQLRARLSRFDARGNAVGHTRARPGVGSRGEYRGPGGAHVAAVTDDLTQIKGIGPAFEDRLRELGYHTFRDIARWDATDFEALGEGFGARVRLSEWSARAAELHRAKYGVEV